MDAVDIERYLTELGRELNNRGIHEPVRILLIEDRDASPNVVYWCPFQRARFEVILQA